MKMNVVTPSSTQSIGNYFYSAPTSPTGDPLSVVNPFNMEQSSDFAFDFSIQLKTPTPFVFAEELFHAGKIRPSDVYSSQVAMSTRKKKKEMKQTQAAYNPAHITYIRQENYVQTSNRSTSSSLSSSSSKKWSLKDMFRSLSQAPYTNKELLKKNHNEKAKSWSYRYSSNPVSSGRKRQAQVSAHELHYRVNRAASEEMRRKSFLPYKHLLFGC